MSASVSIPGISTRPAPWACPCTRCQTGGSSPRDSSQVVICSISASCEMSMRFASSSMSLFVLRFGTSAVMCSAWAWWWIIPFMKATSAFVCGVCSISSSSSGDSV